ncbi:MAG TPA: hypothetical protein VIA63_01085, partial [Candidatus Limnocylindria bacterium]
GPGKRRSGPVPAWGLKLGGALTTFAVFAGSFGYTSTHLYITNAPLKPATVEVAAADTAGTETPATSTASTTTTTLTSTVTTTSRSAVTKTDSS